MFGDARMGAQVGGLVGGIASGVWQYGLRTAAWEAGGALIGGGAGYGYYGTAQGTLFGANLGMFAGGIARGIAGRAGAILRERGVKAAPRSMVFRTGAEAEAYLAKLYPGGQTQVRFTTGIGTGATRGRIVDLVVDKVAREAKVGYLPWNSKVLTQIEKDAWLLKNEPQRIKGAVWSFFRSAVTGKVGADPRVLDELTKNGISYVIH